MIEVELTGVDNMNEGMFFATLSNEETYLRISALTKLGQLGCQF